MTDAVIVNYTQSQMNCIISDLSCLYTNLANNFLTFKKYSIGCSKLDVLKEVFLYRWALDGQIDYEVLEIEELNDIVNRVKNLTSSC